MSSFNTPKNSQEGEHWPLDGIFKANKKLYLKGQCHEIFDQFI